MNLKAFAGFAAWGLIAASVSLILVFAATIFSGSAESVEINGVNVSTSAPGGATSGGSAGIVVANGTTVLYNFTLNISAGNVSIINITFPSWPFDSASANISLVNTSSVPANVQFGPAPAFSGWTVRYIENFTNGGIKTIQFNASIPSQTIAGPNVTWFAFNATANITGKGNLTDNQTMTWHIYTANETHSALVKTTTIVDNNPPRILATRPLVNSSGNTYIRGLSNEVFQVNVTEAELNVSARSSNDGSTNVTVWYKQSSVSTWNSKTMQCFNETGISGTNDPTKTLYMCNTTIDLSQGGALGVLEEDVIDFFFNASDLVLNTGYNGTQAVPRKAQVDRTPPTSSSVASNMSYINVLSAVTSNISLNVQFDDNFQLANATLGTNETNEGAAVFTNYTANNTYSSPIEMAGGSYVLNFTWKNTSLKTGFIVGWRVTATDKAGNQYTTSTNAFTIDNDAPSTHGGFINRINNDNVSGVFLVNVSVNDTLSGMSFVYLNISYEAPSGSINGINNVTLTQGITGYWNATVNSTLNLPRSPADGNYTFRIVANDSLNNLNNSVSIKVWIDNTPPVVSITLPSDASVISGLFTVTAQVTDAVRVSNVQYRVSNASFSSGVWFPMLNDTGDITIWVNNSGYYNSTNLTTAAVFLDGVYNVTIRANDSANNFTFANVSITIDNVQNGTVLDPASYTNGTIRKAGQTINLNISLESNRYGNFPANTYHYNVSVYAYNSSGTAIFVGNISNTSSPLWANGSVTIPANSAGSVIDDGNRTFLFKVYDSANNLLVNGSTNYTVSIDNTAANYSNPSPLNNSYITGSATQLFQISMTEVNMNITKNVTLYWGNGPGIPTTWNAKTLLCSGTLLYNLVGSNWVCNTTIDLSGQPNNRIIYYFFNNSNVTDPNGDKAGNGGAFGTEVAPLNTTVDRTNPAVGVLLPLGRANVSGSFTLNISVNNTPAGIGNVTYRITNDTWQSDPIHLSRGAGTVTAGYWNGTNNTVGLPALGDGLYRISVNATDNAGTSNTTVNVTITIDNTKPNVTVVRPTTRQNFSSSIAINATVRDAGIFQAIATGDIKSVEYILANSTWTGPAIPITNTTGGPANFFDMYNGTNFTSAALADGYYNITINATDYANNFNDTQYVSINIDRNAPVISVVTPAANQFLRSPIDINATVNDRVWVWYVRYRIGNGTYAADVLEDTIRMSNGAANATNGGYYNATNISTALHPGVYNITIWANDTTNNIVQVNVSVTIDDTVPGAPGGTTGNITSPVSGIEYFPGRIYKFNKTFNDSVGVVNVTLEIGLPTGGRNYTAFLADDTAIKGNWSANVTDLAANTTGYSLTWYATDQSGNVLKETSFTYVINKNTSAFTTLSVNQTTVERGDFVNITVRSTIRDEINVTLFTNYTGSLSRLTTVVPYPAGLQNITFTGYLKGVWNITANTTVTDNYTANATLESITFLVQDTTRPRLRIFDYANATNVKPGATIRLNVSISDNYGIDSAFNVSVYFNGSVIGSWVVGGNLTNSTFSSNATTAWANGTITIPSSGLNVAGNRTINVTFTDNANNLGYNDSFVIQMDPGAPTWTNNATSPGSDIQYFPGRTYKFNITLADEPFGVDYVTLEFNGANYSASRVAGTIYSGNWTANITDLGANSTATGYYFRWYMNDSSGQWNTSDWLNYTIYTNTSAIARLEVNVTAWERGTAINITSYSLINGLINTTIYANITQFALSALTYVPYPAGIQNITIANSNMGIGPYNITANTTPNANYSANSSVYMITVTMQDSSPWVQMLSPANNSNVSNMFGKMLINVSATDLSGVSTVSYSIGNTTMQTVATGLLNSTGNRANHYNVSIDTALYPEGKYNLTISINDTIGNTNSSYWFNISFDRTGPVIVFNYQLEGTRLVGLTPGNNSYRSGTIVANETITDDTSGVNGGHQVFRIGNATHWMGPIFGLSTIAGAFNGTNVTTGLADGFYNITVTANDTAGNNRTNVTFFYVDNTAPTAVIALSNSTRGTYRPNSTEQIMVQINDASQTNATIDIYTRWPNGTTNLHNTSWAAPGTSAVYSWRIDTSDLVTDQMVKYYVAATDNASNVATGVGTLASPLSNITIDVNCGNAGSSLSFCSGTNLKTTRNGWASVPILRSQIESASSLQSNFTIDNVTKRASIWGLFNYTYFNNGSAWLSFDPNSPPSTNTLTMFNMSGNGQIYWFNINSTSIDVIFRIQ